MLGCVWKFELQFNNNTLREGYLITPSDNFFMMVARFIASMMMHINVEKDVKMGIVLMKYAVNHYKKFLNPYMPFAVGFLSTIIAVIIEINVMVILSGLPDVLQVVVRYVSLASIARIPGIYFSSLTDSSFVAKCKDKKLPITVHRADKPMQDAPYRIKVCRFVYKVWRIAFCSIGFYFMPFTAIFLNFQFMIGPSEHRHIPKL